MARVYNFSAGPAAMPVSVLQEAQREFLDYASSGMSVLEMSHRSAAYQEVIDAAENNLRSLVGIPDSYGVLFLQGGATLQFAAIPMNLMAAGRAGYIVSGHFAESAWLEAEKYGVAECLASSAETHFDRIPALGTIEAKSAGLDYTYICQNNTIFGTMYHELPRTGTTPLVADVSSCFLSLPLNCERYGLFYAGAQKNAGPAGVTVICVRRDLVEFGPASPYCPTYLDFSKQLAKGSMLNTPNTFGIYLCSKVFEWVQAQGGLEAMGQYNQAKADTLYGALDDSDFYRGTAQRDSRSIANVCFRTPTPELDAAFCQEAAGQGLMGLKGHRLVGGIRASIYNAVTPEAVDALAGFMKSFELAHGSRSF
ncbi:3-phosphoserine/phosphohydroxythreonine transaminase [Leptogranulimonas caecicola]|uniref:Phosphoserine aminotransferase n=1 Tax=Leptogranulimonas caecicola TaxID=2894156 RepID=A0AAU9CPA7_9ACTN|nr:3-phosphoserine/phosphohydroxythreonine transaminase [Leptogranulimonas caecicola]BCV19047.1 3-phosphoserine/phosphohydroxythreonine aminotransferase [Atopobiaceae bacterium P1]BDC91441.1 3-phosphoserine/phosphohydroxythreonine aminotransferase [Leptogranulimonas caecicola]